MNKTQVKQINNRPGSIVNVDREGRVSLGEAGIMREEPCEEDPKYELVFAQKRTPSGPNESGKVTIMREIGIKFAGDGGVSTIFGIGGCVLAYEPRQMARGMSMPGTSGRGFATEYGVTTITIGVPEARYNELVQKAAEKRFGLVVGNERYGSGYYWIAASISDVPKDGSVTSQDSDYFLKYQNQTFIRTGGANMATGPVSTFLSLAQRSLYGVFYGNLRLKDTVEKDAKAYQYTLGMTLHHFQLMSFTNAVAPDRVSKADPGMGASWAVPDAELQSIINEINSPDGMEGGDGEAEGDFDLGGDEEGGHEKEYED